MTEIVQQRPGLAPIDWTGVPLRIRLNFDVMLSAKARRVSAVVKSEAEAEDLVRFFGHPDFCPFDPVLLLIDGCSPILIDGMGYAPAAELRDLAVTTWGRMLNRLAANNGRMFDFDTLREKHGEMRREDVAAHFANALQDRIEQHRRNLRTDPFRQPWMPESNRKTFDFGGDA